ncbi:MAG: protein translocase subunit SecD [Dongiaceae bacterium]
MVHFAKWKTWLTLAILLAGIIFAAPNLLTQEQAESLPPWLPHNQISLGLDLRGGSHLLFEVDVAAVVRERLESAKDTLRDVLRRNDIGYTGLAVSNGIVIAQLADPAARDNALSLLRESAGGITWDIDQSGKVQGQFAEQDLRQLQSQVVEQSIEIIRQRIDESGVKEPTIVRQGEDRIIVQLPGVGDPERLEQLIGKTAKLTFQFVSSTVASPVPDKPASVSQGTVALPSDDGGYEIVETRVILGGENLVDASSGRHPTTGEPVVNFEFDSTGARKFGRATADNVGRRFAIVLDGRVISAPVIDEPIPGGKGYIRGRFTAETAHDLAVLLRAGALPAPLKTEEKRTVGAELGADSIAAGKMASIMGLVLICVALVAVYGLFGIFANVALVFNFVLLIAAMSLLQATLTLPGIAGMVLTLGMAVDANVLIHERIREEIRNGRGPVMAIDAGYRSASGTIMDSNLTVIISSAFLYLFGSGTVKGFAITLILGTIISMFTAVVVARLCTVVWLRWTRPQVLPI